MNVLLPRRPGPVSVPTWYVPQRGLGRGCQGVLRPLHQRHLRLRHAPSPLPLHRMRQWNTQVSITCIRITHGIHPTQLVYVSYVTSLNKDIKQRSMKEFMGLRLWAPHFTCNKWRITHCIQLSQSIFALHATYHTLNVLFINVGYYIYCYI
jgi:hypothetical protein